MTITLELNPRHQHALLTGLASRVHLALFAAEEAGDKDAATHAGATLDALYRAMELGTPASFNTAPAGPEEAEALTLIACSGILPAMSIDQQGGTSNANEIHYSGEFPVVRTACGVAKPSTDQWDYVTCPACLEVRAAYRETEGSHGTKRRT